MRGRTRITGIMTAVLMAGIMAGCSVQTGNQVAPTTEKQQTKETVQETELQKPTHPAPSQIQPFPDVEKEIKAEPLIGGKRIILMTDIHLSLIHISYEGNRGYSRAVCKKLGSVGGRRQCQGAGPGKRPVP